MSESDSQSSPNSSSRASGASSRRPRSSATSLKPTCSRRLWKLARAEMLELVLEDDAVVGDAVEVQLGADRLPDLRRAGGDEVDRDGALATIGRRLERLDDLGDAGPARRLLIARPSPVPP